MKNVKYLFATVILGLGLSSCGDSFLTQYPEGGVLLEEQYQKLPDKLQGALLGIYSQLYAFGGDHDTFGQRSIDMYTDIQSGDMAMKKSNYGWFEPYERGNFYSHCRGYLWSYYYDIINLANLCDKALILDVDSAGVSMDKKVLSIMSEGAVPDDKTALNGYCYGQALAIRGWAYAGLLNYYCEARDAETVDFDADALPIYVGKDIIADTLGAPLSTVGEVYDRVYEDLSEAIDLLDYYSTFVSRNSKLEIDADVARLILAYAMLNHGDRSYIVADGKNCYQIALEQAQTVIANGNYTLMTKSELYATGFSDVSAHNWMWGEDVTIENTTGLASFFGQVDIHTYSYAAAGDIKGIDSYLYDQIAATGWDARLGWFRSGSEKFPYCPDGKFYCPKTKDVTALSKVDRNWLCDNVFMRVELAYLIAAEAAFSNNDNATAISYLDDLCSERILDGKDTEYDTWKAGLATNDDVKNAIIYNWRVEMWGEGYSMQLLRRLEKKRALGKNHLSRSDKVLDVTGNEAELYQCQVPTSEVRYNPNVGRSTTELVNNN